MPDPHGSAPALSTGELAARELSVGERSAGRLPAGELAADELALGESSAGEDRWPRGGEPPGAAHYGHYWVPAPFCWDR